MPTANNVTVIPVTLNLHTGIPTGAHIQRKVAGYARVSTDNEEQLTNYEAQVDYYTKYIKRHPEWEFVEVYTDEGISAVMTKHRDGFNRMISDALSGNIDLIVTKSVSRFARNTVDTLTTVRKLKEKGVEVYFEKENIYIMDTKGELLITIMSSLAQEESRSISENVTWGHRKRFADGKVNLPYKRFLGYRKGENGLPEIVPEEAKIVVRIYRSFMEGKSINAIASELTKEGMPTPGHKEIWQHATVKSILTNEKYKGCALLQKNFTVDFLTKTRKENEGEVPQYYVENSHPAIIQPDEWEAVQVEMELRKQRGSRHDCCSPFSGKIICGDCGSVFGSKVWHSTSKYRRLIWQCNHKFDGDTKCTTPHLYEDVLKARFMSALAEYMNDPEERIEGLRYVQNSLCNTDLIDADIESLEKGLELTAEMARSCIMVNASSSGDDYNNQYIALQQKYNEQKLKYNELVQERNSMKSTSTVISGILFELTELKTLPIEWSDRLWVTLIDCVTVYADERLEFSFRDGTKINEYL